MLNFNEFVEAMKVEMQDHYHPEYQVQIENVQKTNCVRTGLVMIKMDETETQKISPVFYLDDLYELHQKGMCLEEITEKLSNFIDSSFGYIPSVKNAISDIEDWDHIKNRIFLKVINGRNKNIIKKCVHEEFLDMAIIPYVQMESEMTVVVKKEFAGLWNVSNEDIMHTARQNMLEQKPATVTDLHELLKQMIIEDVGEEIPEELSYIFEEEPSESMTIITTPDRHWGAYYICHSDIFKNISEQIYNGQNLLIFPSSLHEIIAVPLTEDTDEFVNGARNMVKMINEEEVKKEERLSDNVYRYVAETGEIVFADAREDRRICFRKHYSALGEQFETGEIVDVFTYCGTQNYVKRNGKVIRIPKNVCCKGCKQ